MGLPAIDQELDKLRSQLADLSSHYTERHPDVRKLKEQIAKTEKMRDETRRQSESERQRELQADAGNAALRDDAELQDMRPDAANTGPAAMRIRSRSPIESTPSQRLKAKVDEYQARLNQEPVREQQLADLTRGYEQSKANYDDLLKKKNGSEMATSMELRQQGERFRILDPPSLPHEAQLSQSAEVLWHWSWWSDLV